VNVLADRIGNRLELVFGYGRAVADMDTAAVKKRPEHASSMQDRLEIDEIGNSLARFAVEGQSYERVTNPHDGSRGQIVQGIEV
jgi:hypothetical protein